MPAVHVRIFLRALPRTTTGPSRYWADQGLAYLRALSDAGVQLVAATTVRSGTDLGDPRSPWHEFARCFVQPLHERNYVNIVCGDNGDVHRLFTVGIPNIAITGISPRHPTSSELASMAKYDEVLCPTLEDTLALRTLGVPKAQHVTPYDPSYPDLVKRYAYEQLDAANAHAAR